MNDEVHIVQCAPVDGATMRAQTRFYGETTCEGAAAKAIRQKLVDNVRGPLGIVGFQEGGEHAAYDSFGVYIPSNAVAAT